ncbi:L-histidine N(alpha)-methyltransferase [Amycolatopsis anabasis]|uniref:L-histidine N(alpha)-methyltransferase n=1 Tax=Amycolatopsis anabasis TaxID=1840409 RepID=UPI00131B4158|nr:L-histidine N(alpha)-methyltransferase [Amycolatopsis anabasis]
MEERLKVLELEKPEALWLDGSDLRTSLRASPRRIPSYYGYDQRGSEIFDAITRLPEYYLTATELRLLRTHAREIAELAGCDWLVELGSGSARKTRALLEAMAERKPTTFLPVDVSKEMLERTAERLLEAVADLSVIGLIAKWESGLDWVRENRAGPCVFAFIGSGLGNMLADERDLLLERISDACRPGDYFLTTADFEKRPAMLETAYNDPPGSDLWGQFRLNRLHRINELFGGDFALERYYEYCHYNTVTSTIEARIYASEAQRVRLAGLGMELNLVRGESIVVDYSFKFRRPELVEELGRYRFRVVGEWIDGLKQYGVFLARKE